MLQHKGRKFEEEIELCRLAKSHVKGYGFEIRKKSVINAILDPEHLEERNHQFFATRISDSKHVLRVVYENKKDYLLAITFYSVRRERYGV